MASPSPPGLSKNPHFSFPEEPSTVQQIPSKSRSNSICKTLIVLAILLVIPFFPSQAPDFISQTIFTQFWEIIHLLFIGIAVSYGLFGRKTAQKHEISRNDDDSNAYLSGISHLSSIFEDGSGNLCSGPDEQDVIMQSFYANCNCKCFGDPNLGQTRCVVHGSINSSGSCAKIRSFVSKIGKENIIFDDNSNGQNVKNQTWSSKYSKGESLVVVSNGLGEGLDFKPLNLPLRSLRSSVVGNEKTDSQNRIDSSPTIEAKVKVPKIRGLIPMNLEKQFEDSDGLPPIPWRSRSGRMEQKEDEFNNINPRAHYRPRSVGEFEFERINSRPSNKVSNFSSSPEPACSEVDNAEGEMVISVSRPEIAPLTGDEASLSVGSNNREEGKVGKGKQPIESLDSDTKSLSRAKSVRTIKPRRYGSVKRVKSEVTESTTANDKQNGEIDRHFPMPKPKPKPSLPEFFNEEKEDNVEQNVAETEDDGESELTESCDDEDDAKTNVDYDLGSEVDRKAGEFIAKFREQIRRQKASSVEGYSREFL